MNPDGIAAIDRFRKNAILLWSGQFVSQMGDAVFTGAVAWLAATLKKDAGWTGLAVFAGAVPFLLLGPFAGAWVDRGDRRRIMVASDLVRAALLVAMPFAMRATGMSFAWVVLVPFLLACASTPFLPARDALLPVLAEGRPLLRWNAAYQTSEQLATLVGLWLGGALLGNARGDPDPVLFVIALDGLTFLASAVTLALLVLPKASAASGETPRGVAPRAGSVWRDALDGLSDAAKDPLLLGLLALTALDNLAIMGPAIVGATLYVRDDLALGAGQLAWFEGTMALGYLVGAVVIARFGGAWKKGRMILVGMVLDGLTYVPFYWVRSYPVALGLVFVHGLFIPWIVVGRTSLLQVHVPAARAGRVFSLVHLTVAGMTALSALLAGFIAEATDAPTLFLLAGVFGAVCGLVGIFAMPRLRSAA